MTKRLFGVLFLLCAMALAGLASPALAVETEEGPEAPPPNLEEICATESLSGEFCPEEYAEPSFFQWLLYPLLGVGILMVAGLLFFYLLWQPRFAEERRSKQRR